MLGSPVVNPGAADGPMQKAGGLCYRCSGRFCVGLINLEPSVGSATDMDGMWVDLESDDQLR